jgi:hypothetical protein
MKALSLAIQKIWPMLKFFEKWVKLQGQGQKVKIMVLLESSCHKEHTYEI